MYLSALPPLPKLMGPTRESPQRAKPSHSPFTSLQLMWRNFSRFLEKFLTMFGWRQSFSTAKILLHYRTRLDEVLVEGRVVVGVFWNCWAANTKPKVIFSVELSSVLSCAIN